MVTGLRNVWATKVSGHWAVSAVCQLFVTLEEKSFNPGTIKLKFSDRSGSTDVYLMKWLL